MYNSNSYLTLRLRNESQLYLKTLTIRQVSALLIYGCFLENYSNKCHVEEKRNDLFPFQSLFQNNNCKTQPTSHKASLCLTRCGSVYIYVLPRKSSPHTEFYNATFQPTKSLVNIQVNKHEATDK